MNIEELLSELREIHALEVKARDFYEVKLRRFNDPAIVKALSKIRQDEEGHIQIASELINMIEEYKPEDFILKEALTTFTDKSVFLLVLNVESYQKISTATLKYLVNQKGFRCLYIAVNKPSSTLSEIYKTEGINVDALSFIDCSVMDTGSGYPTVNPENLTELSISISTLLKQMSEPRYIHLDSVSALYIFNQSDKVEAFTQFLIRKLKAEKAGLILVSVKKEVDEKSLQRLRSFCDRALEL
jgi:hypothetical protein